MSALGVEIADIHWTSPDLRRGGAEMLRSCNKQPGYHKPNSSFRVPVSARNSGEISPEWRKKNEIDPPAGDKKWMLGVPCSPDWRQEIKFIGRQIARCWRQENEIPEG
jgi:hypothetical protein